MSFPITRMRRMRTNETTRRMVRENHLRVDDLIMPLFVCPGDGVKNEISSMPGNYQMSIDVLVETGKEILDLGIPAVILFGIPDQKDARGTEAYHDHGIIQRAIAALKSQVPDLYVITDVCLCEYTDHGHCGVIVGEDVKNDETVDLLVQESLSHVRAGADMVAPSDMMDGRVGAIREGLDAEGFDQIPIMAYAAKYCSAFYGPFREAAESAPQFGDRRSYQMDPANGDEALREVDLDLDEGADLVMVKPALSYLDIIYRVKSTFGVPVAAYNVSGEFAMVKAAAQNGWVDEARVRDELLLSMKRAGADLILTYFAMDVARVIK
ncbi:MAG: porphobilinogen synthase [Candidatus Latescibacteria bacterium]|mgnify:CR=1 FL=1|nr:porphobilinogen synthase [Candidatus Latescibacterota bacterium]MBT5830968.1 porphobilinogen synthase [Candidatus Latescibacterota bacterium]